VRVYKDCGARSDMQQYVSVQECMQRQEREAGTDKPPEQIRSGACSGTHRERTIQYEQELESTQEIIRNHAMQWRSSGGTMLGDDVEGGVEW
jgi:hypothetical protein